MRSEKFGQRKGRCLLSIFRNHSLSQKNHLTERRVKNIFRVDFSHGSGVAYCRWVVNLKFMPNEGQEVGPKKVRGFSKETLSAWRVQYGEPISAETEGWIAIDSADRQILGIEVSQVIETIREDIEGATGIRLRVVPGNSEYVGLTGTARERLKLENYKEKTGVKEGDMVTVRREGDRLLISKVPKAMPVPREESSAAGLSQVPGRAAA